MKVTELEDGMRIIFQDDESGVTKTGTITDSFGLNIHKGSYVVTVDDTNEELIITADLIIKVIGEEDHMKEKKDLNKVIESELGSAHNSPLSSSIDSNSLLYNDEVNKQTALGAIVANIKNMGMIVDIEGSLITIKARSGETIVELQISYIGAGNTPKKERY